MSTVNSRSLHILALMESSEVSGPAKNLIQLAATPSGEPGLRFSIVTFQRAGAPENKFAEAARKAGVDVHVLAEKYAFDTAPLRELKNLVDHLRPDIIQSHNIKSHLFVRLLRLHRRYPWIVFQHGYTNIDFKDRIYNRIDRWTLPAAHRVVAVCGAFAERLKKNGLPKNIIRVQHNSVKPFEPLLPEPVSALQDQLNLASRLVILAVGRLSYEKGHADLLQAAEILHSEPGLPEWAMVLVGDGPERNPLQTLARELGVESRIRFAGHHADIRAYYQLADVLSLPSHTEGSPNVVLEAMAAGLPVVACSVGGVPEIVIPGQTGLLVPPGDPRAMAASLGQVMRDPLLRKQLAEAARSRSAAYSPEARYQSLLSMYLEFVPNRR
jgi:glycosyltransferase involved in cell wall biosynthesis